MPETIQGQLLRVTYANEESGYTVARVQVPGRSEPITVVGNFISPVPGEIVTMTGTWDRHPKYGTQFRAVDIETQAPTHPADKTEVALMALRDAMESLVGDRVMRIADVMCATGLAKTAALRLVKDLEALGLPRKGRGKGTHWLASQFWRYYRHWDTRED